MTGQIWSGSIVNAGLRGVFHDCNNGVTFSPEVVADYIFCYYSHDGATRRRKCNPDKTDPHDEADCVPGCSHENGSPRWCEAPGTPGGCSWRPSQLAQMLLEHQQRCELRFSPVCLGAGGLNGGVSRYNEVILDIQGLVQYAYPRGVEAWIVDVTGRCRDLKSRERSLQVAYDDQRAFAEAYGFSVPVLEMDLAADDPFRLPGA